MKAIGYQYPSAAANPDALVAFEAPVPLVSGKDLLVRVKAVSVNPVDTKIRRAAQPEPGNYRVLGWDAAGVVEAVGEQVSLFKVGDKVWYAGAIDRAGSNSELQLVDERIVALMPNALSFTEAAAMPLTSITAWELLFERFNLTAQSNGNLLIIGASGGVGSMMIQLAKKLTSLTVIATASRPQTKAWVSELGADYVIGHGDLRAEINALAVGPISYVASLTHTEQHLDSIVELIAPQGHFGVIDDPKTLDIMPFKSKSVTVHWELMFTRSLFQTDDMIKQHELLSKVSQLVEHNDIKTTLVHDFGNMSPAALLKAHQLLESGKSWGKIALAGI